MKGCRPLDTNEILKISEQFSGTDTQPLTIHAWRKRWW